MINLHMLVLVVLSIFIKSTDVGSFASSGLNFEKRGVHSNVCCFCCFIRTECRINGSFLSPSANPPATDYPGSATVAYKEYPAQL